MAPRARIRFRPLLLRGGIFAALWVSLVGADPEGLALGVAVVPAAVALSLRLMPESDAFRPGRLLSLLPGFHLRSLMGGIDVAARVVTPRMPLAPVWVVEPVALSPAGRVLLGAQLSLMPGTLVAGADGDRLLVHALDRAARPREGLRAEEARLALLFPPDAPACAAAPPSAPSSAPEPGA